MPTYVVTGTSRGLGYAFLKLFAADTKNTVIGLTRNKSATDKKLAEDGLHNVHIYEADICDLPALKTASTTIQEKFGSVDYLICNAAYISGITRLKTLADFDDNPAVLEDELIKSFRVNVIGLVNTLNSFMPLILKGSSKKVITITSGMGDCDFVNESGMDIAGPYAISKAGVNMVVAKYNTMYRSEGVLVMGICAGSVNTAEPPAESQSAESTAILQVLVSKLFKYAPDFKGPVSPEQGVKNIMKVAEAASLETGSGGKCVSYLGTKRWL